MTPQKTAAEPEAPTQTPWSESCDPWRARPEPWAAGAQKQTWNQAPSATPTLAPSGGWQEQAWCQPASPTWQEQAWCQPASPTWVQAPSATPTLAPSSEWQKQPWCQPASQNQWQGSGWGWTNYSDNGWNDLKESNSYHGYYANGWSDLKEIHHKDLKAPDTYSGDITQWKAWSRAFERYLRRRDTRWPGLLEKVQEFKGKPVTEEYEKKWARGIWYI